MITFYHTIPYHCDLSRHTISSRPVPSRRVPSRHAAASHARAHARAYARHTHPRAHGRGRRRRQIARVSTRPPKGMASRVSLSTSACVPPSRRQNASAQRITTSSGPTRNGNLMSVLQHRAHRPRSEEGAYGAGPRGESLFSYMICCGSGTLHPLFAAPLGVGFVARIDFHA